MGKKNKKNKKNVTPKTIQQRQQEIQNIKDNISQLGLGEGNPDIQKLYQTLDHFATSGDSWSGSIPLTGFKRNIQLILTTKPHLVSSCQLNYNPDI